MIVRPKKDLIEVFGYAPDDLTPQCRSLWKLSACPFINKRCTKANHDGSVIYGTCSVTSAFGHCVICPGYSDIGPMLIIMRSGLSGSWKLSQICGLQVSWCFLIRLGRSRLCPRGYGFNSFRPGSLGLCQGPLFLDNL